MRKHNAEAKGTYANAAGCLACKVWLRKVSKALADYDHTPEDSIRLYQLPDEHKVLLMNWKAWSLHFAVDASFILATLLDYYQHIRHHGTGFFGIRVAQLTGQRALEILQQQIALTYPAGECYAVRDSEIRARLLNHQLKKFSKAEPTLEAEIKRYRERLHRTHVLDAELPKRFTRAWRNNPFRRQLPGLK